MYRDHIPLFNVIPYQPPVRQGLVSCCPTSHSKSFREEEDLPEFSTSSVKCGRRPENGDFPTKTAIPAITLILECLNVPVRFLSRFLIHCKIGQGWSEPLAIFPNTGSSLESPENAELLFRVCKGILLVANHLP